MTQHNYGLKPDTRPVYEPAPEPKRPSRKGLVPGMAALMITLIVMALAWIAALSLSFIGSAL